MASERSGPLRGIRIIDLTRALAGPFCGMLLADLGADIIKVEPPGGDMTRFSGPYTRSDSDKYYGGYFGSINRNRRGIVLDFGQEADRETLLRLVDSADGILENFRPGVMERFGLGYETLAERNPRLVYAAIRGFGDPRTGESPYADWPAFDVVAQAMSGVVSITGTEDGEMLRTGPSIGDLYPATMAALGLCAALVHAGQTGEGQFMDVAMYDSLVALCEAPIYRYSYMGMVTAPTGNSHPQLAPFDIYPTADGACAIAAPTDSHWPTLCDLIGRPELADDDRTRENRDRIANKEFVHGLMSDWTSARTTAEVVELLAGRVPVGPVNTTPDIYRDPHVAARQMLVAVDHPGSDRPVVYPNSPIKYTATPAGIYRRAPKLAEHQAEILAELEENQS
ncbi:MAG: CoA transferase [Actinomycetia bacterium]|nr:CoA transferase [Actinomycetes bacterium]